VGTNEGTKTDLCDSFHSCCIADIDWLSSFASAYDQQEERGEVNMRAADLFKTRRNKIGLLLIFKNIVFVSIPKASVRVKTASNHSVKNEIFGQKQL
jgi:hypothetical protein